VGLDRIALATDEGSEACFKEAGMDFRFTAEQEALRKEFEEFFVREMKNAPPSWIGTTEDIYDSDENWAFHRAMGRKLGERGWLSLPWPREYGGQGHGPIEQLIFNEVYSYHHGAGVDNFLRMIAPTLLEYGTEEQKREFLPRSSRAEIYWCQGWSEPNAGSDLAALTTRAVEDGDDYIINGQKTWTSGAHRSDWTFMVARTDPTQPRHRGISFFVVDMKTPGVKVRNIPEMGGMHSFNEVFFDDVRVPKRYMIGERNRGWYVTLATMNFERSGSGRYAEHRRHLEDLVEFCKETVHNGKPLSESPLVRHRLAQLMIELDAGRALARRIAWLQSKGELVAAEASASKAFGTELGQRLAYTACQVMGMYGQLEMGSKWAPLRGMFTMLYCTTIGMNIAAGTSEIQRNIIAQRGLDLRRI
jgi:alkylation response protein AidB-like acyl-CoA dehydrogenase